MRRLISVAVFFKMADTLIMNTTTKTKNAIENLISSRYGANALSCDAIVIEWAAGKLAESDVNFAAKEWRRINSRREKLGRYTTIPQYGSELFAAFAK
jgi:hypothetical protein